MINDFEVEIDLNDFLKALAEEGKKEAGAEAMQRDGLIKKSGTDS